jgi:hypothetical protein
LYKGRRLAIDMKTCDGRAVSYRFVPSMAARSVLLSPLVESQNDFVRYFFGGGTPDGNRVAQFLVRYDDSESPVTGWDTEFQIWLAEKSEL